MYEIHYKDRLRKTWKIWKQEAGNTIEEAQEELKFVKSFESVYDAKIVKVEK